MYKILTAGEFEKILRIFPPETVESMLVVVSTYLIRRSSHYPQPTSEGSEPVLADELTSQGCLMQIAFNDMYKHLRQTLSRQEWKIFLRLFTTPGDKELYKRYRTIFTQFW
jgi:hypothetical protein